MDHDRALVLAALERQKRGEKPTREESAALRRAQAARTAELQREHYAAIPKKLWRQWSGRQHKVLDEQAARYGLPIAGPTIDLAAVARWLHEFLAANARKLAGSDDADFAGATSPALERKRLADAKRSELAYERELGLWVRLADLHATLARLLPILRTAGDALLRQFGAAAQQVLNDALDNCERETGRLLERYAAPDTLTDAQPDHQ